MAFKLFKSLVYLHPCKSFVKLHHGSFHNLRGIFIQKRTSSGLSAGIASKLEFDNHSLSFQHRPLGELIRAYCVLFVCSFDQIVSRSLTHMQLGERIFGERLLGLMMSPLYRQFVSGNTEEEMYNTVMSLSQVNINLMAAPCLETDVGEGSSTLDELYLKNYLKTLQLVDLSSRHRPKNKLLKPLCQTKITAHISADVLFNLSTIYESLSHEEKLHTICSMSDAIHSSGLDSSPETVGQTETFLSQALKGKFSKQDLDEVKKALPRLHEIGSSCYDKGVVLTIDAEYSYVNQAIGLFALAMMKLFNKSNPVVWNTYQGYLKKGPEDIAHDYNISKDLGVTFGAKIVRGAYLEKEREYARKNNTLDPTNESYELTNEVYNSIVEYLSSEVAANPAKCHMVVATHNEASILKATQRMGSLGMENDAPSLVFAQIYGMAENISVTLAKAGYNVYKSVAYGSVGEVLPYLSRRANENRAVFHGTRKELMLLRKEIHSRMLFRSST